MPIPSGQLPAPRTWVDGIYMTGAVLNHELRDPLQWLLAPPSIKTNRKTNQNLTNDTDTEIIWEAEEYKNDIQHSSNVDENPTRLVINTPGVYLFTCRIEIEAQASGVTGRRDLSVLVNGSNVIVTENNSQPATGTPTRLSLAGMYPMAAGDYFTAKARQASGGGLNLTGPECEFAVKLVSR